MTAFPHGYFPMSVPLPYRQVLLWRQWLKEGKYYDKRIGCPITFESIEGRVAWLSNIMEAARMIAQIHEGVSGKPCAPYEFPGYIKQYVWGEKRIAELLQRIGRLDESLFDQMNSTLTWLQIHVPLEKWENPMVDLGKERLDGIDRRKRIWYSPFLEEEAEDDLLFKESMSDRFSRDFYAGRIVLECGIGGLDNVYLDTTLGESKFSKQQGVWLILNAVQPFLRLARSRTGDLREELLDGLDRAFKVGKSTASALRSVALALEVLNQKVQDAHRALHECILRQWGTDAGWSYIEERTRVAMESLRRYHDEHVAQQED